MVFFLGLSARSHRDNNIIMKFQSAEFNLLNCVSKTPPFKGDTGGYLNASKSEQAGTIVLNYRHMYTTKNFEHLLGTEGFSDTSLKNHFKLYEGYVNNVNTLVEKMNAIRVERADGNDESKEESAELHRRFGWEYNGMKLHELYFENISKENTALDDDSNLAKEIVDRFGSMTAMEKNFKSNVGMFRGIGWVALIRRDDTLGIVWIGEHDEGLLANSEIILIMDVFEHAYITDYEINRAEYIDTFWKNIDWNICVKRFDK